MNDIITVGSPTSTGGKVLTGNSSVKVNGQSIALVGDIASCTCGSKQCRGQGKIVKQTPRNANLNGQDLARAGDLVDTGCGNCVLLPSQHQVALGTSMETSFNIGSGVNIGNGVSINMGAGTVTQSATSTAQPATTNQTPAPQWQPLLHQPEVIYHTRNQMNDTTADDMQYGDLPLSSFSREVSYQNSLGEPDYSSTSYVTDLQGKRHKLDFTFKESHLQKSAAEHFAIMKDGMKFWTFWPFGHIEHVLTELIDRFQANTGGIYSHPDLSKGLQQHDTTAQFHRYVTQAIADYLTQNNGTIANDLRTEVSKVINREASLPAFSDYFDQVKGGTLAVHGIYALQVQVNSLEVKQGKFRGTVEYKAQDHFGLDIGDVTEDSFLIGKVELFRSWFYLQRYRGYGFKPFITEMVFELGIEGEY